MSNDGETKDPKFNAYFEYALTFGDPGSVQKETFYAGYDDGQKALREALALAVKGLERYQNIKTGQGHNLDCMAYEVGDDNFCNCSLYAARTTLAQIAAKVPGVK